MASNLNANNIKISSIYTIYFLWYEAFAALGGTYLAFFHPVRLIQATVPATTLAANYETLLPVTNMLLFNIGSLYGLFAIAEGVVLRLTRQRNIWYTILGSFVFTDICHLYALYVMDPARITDFMAWNADEWVNYGTLTLGLTLRLAFFAGFGRN